MDELIIIPINRTSPIQTHEEYRKVLFPERYLISSVRIDFPKWMSDINFESIPKNQNFEIDSYEQYYLIKNIYENSFDISVTWFLKSEESKPINYILLVNDPLLELIDFLHNPK
jgi:hypothetical protein